MAFVYYKISDTASELDEPLMFPAYWGPSYMNSPSGNYTAGVFTTSNTSTAYVVDTSQRPPALAWSGDIYLGEVPGYEIAVYTTPLSIDDDGTLWADSANDDGNILAYPVDTHTPSTAFTLTNADGYQNGLSATQIYTPSTSGGAIRVIIVPGGTVGHDNPHVFLGTKGTPGLTDFDTGGDWVVWDAFLDDNDDVWVAGAPPASVVGPTTTMKLWRLTDLTAASPYTELLTFTMPVASRMPRGFFSGGSYIGAWGDGECDWYFNANLTTGALTTRDISVTPVHSGFGRSYRHTVPSNPEHYFFIDADASTNRRTLREIKADLTDGLTYALASWEADDGPLVGEVAADSTVRDPLYLDGEMAFAGVRHFDIDSDNNQGDFYLYLFAGDDGGDGGDGGDGLQDDSLRLRVWGYSLDGHDYYVLRVGPSESLIYDLTTGTWSSWASPGRDNWRAHVGQNWIGMSTDTFELGFGTDVVAGDDSTGVLWILDPTTGRDDRTTTGDDPFNRVVTGGISLSGREVAPCGALQLDYSTGNPTQTGATFTLETSDDWGRTFDDQGTVTVATADFTGVVEFRGLGLARAPGRVFRITDNGAAVRISGADLR